MSKSILIDVEELGSIKKYALKIQELGFLITGYKGFAKKQ